MAKRSNRKAPNSAHMARAHAFMELAANPPRRVHKPKPYRGEIHRGENVLSPKSSWGRTTSEFLGEGFSVR